MIATWKPPASQARDASVKQVSDALKAYSPGGKPGGGMLIDGGGFQIVDDGSKSGYFRAMYESLKNGYIDDLELFVGEDGKSAQVRSSSPMIAITTDSRCLCAARGVSLCPNLTTDAAARALGARRSLRRRLDGLRFVQPILHRPSVCELTIRMVTTAVRQGKLALHAQRASLEVGGPSPRAS